MAKKVENKLKEEVKEIKVDGNVSLGDPAPKVEVKVEPKVKASKEEQPLGNTTRAFRQ